MSLVGRLSCLNGPVLLAPNRVRKWYREPPCKCRHTTHPAFHYAKNIDTPFSHRRYITNSLHSRPSTLQSPIARPSRSLWPSLPAGPRRPHPSSPHTPAQRIPSPPPNRRSNKVGPAPRPHSSQPPTGPPGKGKSGDFLRPHDRLGRIMTECSIPGVFYRYFTRHTSAS